MSDNVISLASRRRNQTSAEPTPLAQVQALLVRVHSTARMHEDSLLIPSQVLTDLTADVIATITASLEANNNGRTAR
ncbi:hypothetical protein GCM10027425_12320 [Alteromonas gracilis]